MPNKAAPGLLPGDVVTYLTGAGQQDLADIVTGMIDDAANQTDPDPVADLTRFTRAQLLAYAARARARANMYRTRVQRLRKGQP